MAAREVIVASVRDFLAEIQQLNLEKEGLEVVNPTKAAYLQSQIWRKFTIIQSLMDSLPKTLKEEILRKRKEFKAEAKDLRLMQVPQAVDAKIVQGWLDAEEGWRAGPFPYLELPPEVRQVILGFLDCPNDQLTLGEVLPADGYMMGWNKNALKFEKVLSILMARKMITYGDIKSLILAGDYMQVAASNWFETSLKEFFTTVDLTYHQSTRVLEKVTSDEFPLNPIPVCIEMYFLPDDNDEDGDLDLRKEKQFQILRVMGHHIWDCVIRIDGMTMMQSMTLIKELLALMPNVKYVRLVLFRFSDYPNPDGDDLSYFEDVELPDLPNLRGLNFGWIPCDAFVTKLLRRYGSSLTHLKTKQVPLVSLEDAILFPRLTVVNVQIIYYAVNANQPQPLLEIARLRNLAGSPLKVVRFDIDEDQRRIPSYFRNLLSCLNQFGQTLEELEITFSKECVSDRGRIGDLTWLGNIEFPKVKKLSVWNHPDTWNFVLHFPVLETLTWNYPRENRFDIFEPEKHFRFSGQEWDMCASDVWKILPFLKSIEFCHFGTNKIIRTRSEALAHQAKQGGRKPKRQAEMRQENAVSGTRKSARIANMKKQN